MDLPSDIGVRVGLLGGTFDPVHNGHLALAACARERCRLDAVVFIPAANPPHKEQRSITDLRHRCRMLELACGIGSGYYVSSLEAERRGPSYTVDTLRTLKDYYPSGNRTVFHYRLRFLCRSADLEGAGAAFGFCQSGGGQSRFA